MYTIEKSAEALFFTNDETVLEVNAEKISCITMPRGQNSGLTNVGTLHSFENSHKISKLHA